MPLPGFRHFGLKVLSIVLAALIWLIVSGEQIVERALRIPLEFTNLPAELELIGDTPDVVDVRVRGSSGALSRVAAGELVAVLDLRTARSGRRLFHLTGNDVRSPFGIEVVQISPSNISIMLEISATKIVPVVPELDGDPRDGYVVGTVAADPATVEVAGPVSAVERLTRAITEPVSIAGASDTITETVNVGVADPAVRLVSPVGAQVTVNITPAPVEWAVAGIPVRPRSGSSADISPAVVTIFVRGPREARNWNASEFSASVDVEGLQSGVFLLPVQVTPPARVGVIHVEPPTVRVRVQ
ncbi:MAG TPA: CdaR family protein [Vicinamibacterales bacterium]